MVYTVVPALGDPRRERPPAMYGHIINVPTHFNVKLSAISGHLPNADSHLLVVSTWYNGQCKQMPRFRWSFQPKIAGSRPNCDIYSSHKLPCCRMVTDEQYVTSSRVINRMIAAINPFIGYVCFTILRRKSHVFCSFNSRCRRKERFLVWTKE